MCFAIFVASIKAKRFQTFANVVSDVVLNPKEPLKFYTASDLKLYANPSSILGPIPLAIHIDALVNNEISRARKRLTEEAQEPVTTAQILRLITHTAIGL